jgi:hypothetical protein
MRRFLVIAFLCLAVAGVAFADDGASFLPKSFAGWTQTGPVKVVTDPAQVDAAYPAILKEYGFVGSETATYTREDGRKLTVKAAKFNDASGAYGAFTFYRQPAMKTEEIGSKAASANERVLFFRDNVLVDASFDRLTGMSGSELRELAAALPEVKGNAANLPNLPNYLPKKDAVENSAKYILGSQALLATHSALTPDDVDFSHDPEILTQNYSSPDGPLALTLLAYPTPQIAGERLRALQNQATANPSALLARRTGPIVVVVTGTTNSADAKSLLNAVNYEAQVTWNEATSVSKRDNIGNLIIGIFGLIGILLLFGVIFGVFFGGIRVLVKRYFPDSVFDRPEQVEIIQLHLKE